MNRLAAALFSTLAIVSANASANVIFEWVQVSGAPASLRVELTDWAIQAEGADYFRTFACDERPRPVGCEQEHTEVVHVGGGWRGNTFTMWPSSGYTGWVQTNLRFQVMRNGYLAGYIKAHTDETEYEAGSRRPTGELLGPLWGISFSRSDRSFRTCFSLNECDSYGYLVATSPIPEIPEPGTFALLGLAAAGLVAVRSRKKKAGR